MDDDEATEIRDILDQAGYETVEITGPLGPLRNGGTRDVGI
jgi:hypothetical protein